MSTAETPPATTVRYLVDAKGSTFTVRAFAAGMLSAFGHNPTIVISDFQGEVQWSSSALEDASLRIVIQAASLAVTDDISANDRREIESRMRDEVLEVDGFSEILYECPRVSSVQKIGEGLFMGGAEWRAVHARSHPHSAGLGPSDAEWGYPACRRGFLGATERL